MTYWNEREDSHLRIWNTQHYGSYWTVKDQFNSEGYRGDLLTKSDVLYLGACDVLTNLQNGELRWSERIHKVRHSNSPFIALGTVGAGLQTAVRRLYSYISHFGPPKLVYLTVPRWDSYEFVNKSGKCYSVSTRAVTANFCKKAGFIDDEEHSVWLKQLQANTLISNQHNTLYLLEERFAFIEMICKAHNIELLWTFNPSDACTLILYENISALENISQFMKECFVGMPALVDHAVDRSIWVGTHIEIANKFLHRDHWDFERIREQATKNFNWAKSKYGDSIIMGEFKDAAT